MITIEIIKELKKLEDDKFWFNRNFMFHFFDLLRANLISLEMDHIIHMFALNEFNELRTFLDDMTNKSKQKVLDALEIGESDIIHEKRYKDVKEVNDLFTYYYDIMVK